MSTRNNIALYKSCVYCKHKTTLVPVYFYNNRNNTMLLEIS